ncbi:uncharacterized protein METZ01_LOCUS104566 [marine metagenome]|uniref:tRNA/rRNA methyltransferase SpoU type domain-containing protein n=1 Tax=marine metagenome TaxID=408172 RepID=A0A381WGY9_9ZZZZ|tara:strand:- start:273 stop:812 length:540 start_codon:yes stop_codon:yes gene_type:complete
MRKLKNTELNRKSIEEFKKAEKTPAIVILDNIRSIHNVGSIFRTSDSFLIKKVFICGITATPENQRMEKTALGSTDSVDWEYMKDPKELINKLEKDNVIIVSVEQADQSIKIQDFKPVDGFDYAFVFGNEVDGVRDEFIKASKHVLEIPQQGTKHSLNVSVAAGVILWDFYKKCGLDNT